MGGMGTKHGSHKPSKWAVAGLVCDKTTQAQIPPAERGEHGNDLPKPDLSISRLVSWTVSGQIVTRQARKRQILQLSLADRYVGPGDTCGSIENLC